MGGEHSEKAADDLRRDIGAELRHFQFPSGEPFSAELRAALRPLRQPT
jgi:hypothetical protein